MMNSLFINFLLSLIYIVPNIGLPPYVEQDSLRPIATQITSLPAELLPLMPPLGSPSGVFDAIIELSKNDDEVKLEDICEYLDLSALTIREDFRILVKDLRIVKKHGFGKDAVYDISFLGKRETTQIQSLLREHFQVLAQGMRKLPLLQKSVVALRRRYRPASVRKDLIAKISDNAQIEELRRFVDNEPPVGRRHAVTMEVGSQGRLTVFRLAQVVTVGTELAGELVRVEVKRTHEDLVTVKVNLVDQERGRKGRSIYKGFYFFSQNPKKPSASNRRKIVTLRNYYKLWLTRAIDTMPTESLPMNVIRNLGAYAFHIRGEAEDGNEATKDYIYASVPIDLLRLKEDTLRKLVYGRATQESGKRSISIYLKKSDKTADKAITRHEFDTEKNKFILLWHRMVQGTNPWYRGIAKGEVLVSQRKENAREVNVNKSTMGHGRSVYLWEDMVGGAMKSVRPGVSYVFKTETELWQYSVPEEPNRIELINKQGAESLDEPGHYQGRIARFFYDKDSSSTRTAEEELLHRATTYFTHKGRVDPPDPIVVLMRPKRVHKVCSVAGSTSTVTSPYVGRNFLYEFGRGAGGRRTVAVYLLDKFYRPFAKLREGYFKSAKKLIIWNNFKNPLYIDAQERQRLAILMWELGYAPCPDVIGAFLKYISEDESRSLSLESDEQGTLRMIVKKLQNRTPDSVEKLIASLGLNVPVRRIKEVIAHYAKDPKSNPHYLLPVEWEMSEDISDEKLLDNMGMMDLIDESVKARRPLNELLLTCQRALFVEALRFTKRESWTKAFLRLKDFKKRARIYKIDTDDPKWALNGATELIGRHIQLPLNGMRIREFTDAVRDIYIRAVLKTCRNNQAKARDMLKINIWEFNRMLSNLGITPTIAAPPQREFKDHLEAFLRYNENPYSHAIESAKIYFRKNYDGEKAVKIAKMLDRGNAIEGAALRNIALIRVLTFVPKSARLLVESYVMEFLNYSCIFQEELDEALSGFMRSVGIDDGTSSYTTPNTAKASSAGEVARVHLEQAPHEKVPGTSAQASLNSARHLIRAIEEAA